MQVITSVWSLPFYIVKVQISGELSCFSFYADYRTGMEIIVTIQEKRRILDLHDRGKTNKEIADQTGINAGTIRTFISRYNLQKENESQNTHCEECFTPIIQPAEGKVRRFCCTQCRIRWWNKHRNVLNSGATHTRKCPVCGKSFVTYKDAKFCSRVCYIASFRREEADCG